MPDWYERPASQQQINYIFGLARRCVIDFEGEEDLDRLVKPVYECRVEELNKGQASMLIEDLLYECGEAEEAPSHPSIFQRGDFLD